MKRTILFLLLLSLPLSAAPRRRAVQPPATASAHSFDFNFGALGWEAGFSDYSPGTDMRLDAKIAPLPPELGTGQGFFITGTNRSDDLFMFLRRRLTAADGIAPNRSYVVDYTIRFGSQAESGCIGIGGAPGESVYLKAGATPQMPQSLLEGNQFRMNVDKGNQATGGPAASVVGNVANGRPCGTSSQYASLVRTHRHTSAVRSSAEGDLWLLVGTDSGFEGTTALYYQRIDVTLTPID